MEMVPTVVIPDTPKSAVTQIEDALIEIGKCSDDVGAVLYSTGSCLQTRQSFSCSFDEFKAAVGNAPTDELAWPELLDVVLCDGATWIALDVSSGQWRARGRGACAGLRRKRPTSRELVAAGAKKAARISWANFS